MPDIYSIGKTIFERVVVVQMVISLRHLHHASRANKIFTFYQGILTGAAAIRKDKGDKIPKYFDQTGFHH